MRLILREGADGKARITLRGEGVDLRLPQLGLLAPVVVRLQTSDGEQRRCREATYSGSIPSNDEKRFTADSD